MICNVLLQFYYHTTHELLKIDTFSMIEKNSAYWFVNEVQIRIGAGIMFTVWLFTFLSVYYAGMCNRALIVVWLFWLDFLLKVINPKYSLIWMIAKQLSQNKEPQRVWAIQKRFARWIGLVLSSIVFWALINRVIIHGTTTHIPETLSRPMYICILCLVFMRLEAILWRCAGCKIFECLVNKKFINNTDHQTCPDGVCKL